MRYKPETAELSVPRVVSRAGAMPISMGMAKRHLRITHDLDDLAVRDCILAARDYLEARCGITFTTTTYDVSFACFPAGADVLRLPRPPLQSLTSISYEDADGASQTYSTANVNAVSDNPIEALLTPTSGNTWPGVEYGNPSPVTIRYVAGWGDAASDVPDNWRQAIKFMTAHLFDNREAMVTGVTATKLPFTLEAMIQNIGTGHVVSI